jgi:hypothetical protein
MINADMDSKIKLMIRIIEEDAESFAKRAEMYYRRRPELMTLLEELYRAYRALAERYDHAAGELRQARQKIAEAFPDQVLMDLDDDLPTDTASIETGMENPDMSPYFLSFINASDSKRHAKGKSTKFCNCKYYLHIGNKICVKQNVLLQMTKILRGCIKN